MDLLNAMRLFTRVVETGSFSETARRLGLDQSSVSRQVSALEDQLGVRLLNRTTRRLSLTEAGQLYYERASAIVGEVEDANAAVLQLNQSPRGLLRINAPQVFGRLHLVPALTEFLAEHSEVQVDLTLTDHLVDLVEAGDDVAIRIGEPGASTLVARKLAENPWVVCGSPEYLARRGEPETPGDLTRHNCLTRKRVQHSRDYVWEFVAPDGTRQPVNVTGNLQTNNPEGLRAAALGGLGLVRLNAWTVGKDLQSGALRPVLTDYEVSPMGSEGPIYAVYPYNRHLSPKVRAFIDFMVARLASGPPHRPPAEGRNSRTPGSPPPGAESKGAAGG